MIWILWSLGLIGHLGLWCVVFNRIHATAWPRSSRKLSEKVILLMVVIPIAYVVIIQIDWERLGFGAGLQKLIDDSQRFVFGASGWGYAIVCLALGVFFVLRWLYRKLTFKLPDAVIANQRNINYPQREIDGPLLHGWFAKLIGSLPLNEVVQLTTQEISFRLGVPPALDGLKICQLSDLHFTGQIGIEYFQQVVRTANAFDPDLIFITGDLVDEIECLPWLDQTIGQLRARHGVFYVLGNHDLRIKDELSYRKRLAELNLICAAGKWQALTINGVSVAITGNELPWYAGAERLPPLDVSAGLKILLSHSPDQIDWARPHKFDLIFAGHTHGGQIALPIIGPLVAPSKYGIKYAAGTFQIDSTVMHVSRGLSGDEPIRFCSPPELGLFTIRSNPLVVVGEDR